MEKRKFGAEIGKVLDLMINALYTNKDIFLRELISNASDACDKLRYLSIENPSLMPPEHNLKISVRVDKANQSLIITDSGIGMNRDDLIESLGVIASSGTQKFLNATAQNPQADMSLIGQFGVGFYSAFMVADEVSVISRKAGEEKAYTWLSQGKGEFEVGEFAGKTPSIGTSINLKIKPQEEKYLDKFNLRHIIATYSDHIAFPIELIDEDGNIEVVNKASALWTRPKNEISEEQYNEFYHHVAHSPDSPWLKMHNKVEGTVEYTSLLFIPSVKPFDLFHPDRKTRVKLYIKRVFITDDTVSLVPQYLRFLRGVVDSEDLPLNISRETIQHNQTLAKIRKSIIKKIFSELKAKAKDDPKDYAKFWGNFGEVLKEGLCEHALEEKEALLEICRFNTSNSDDLTSLDEYVERMAEDQTAIYFITGDDLQKLRSHPRLEGFTKRGIEVLLLSDYVDDFWVNVINQYKDKELKNISTADINLDEIKKLDTKDEEPSSANIDTEKLIAFFKSTLKENVKDVKVTSKLVDSPACLALPEGYMTMRMEKLLIEQKQLKSASSKILEINPKHFLMEKIDSLLKAANDDKASDLVWLSYDQACILEGEKVSDPKAFIGRVNALLRE
ncbi:MAG: htpG [Candidatus Midichloriaceae bacterium]|jgi:molecular chaperone HtpG|nr:htpG [Candidatus Midichloriaceae bacterium]